MSPSEPEPRRAARSIGRCRTCGRSKIRRLTVPPRGQGRAEVLPKSMGVHLGALIYVTNQISAPQPYPMAYANNAAPKKVLPRRR